MPKAFRNSKAEPVSETKVLPAHITGGMWIEMLFLGVVMAAAWWNSLGGVFLLDDVHSITANVSIRDFWSFAWLNPPHTIGETVGGRPFLNFTFAVDYALHGEAARGYHVTNFLIHWGAALGVLAVLRRVLSVKGPDGGQGNARLVALAITVLWSVHPLLTGAVTYLSQRAESLAGFFVVTGFYAYLRSRDAERSGRWLAASAGLAFLGAMSKETAITLPVLVSLHAWMQERSAVVFWKRWRALLISYGIGWGIWLATVGGDFRRGGSAGWESQVGVSDYLPTQLLAVGHYLRQAFWPDRLIFDFGSTLVSGITQIWIQLILAAGLIALAVSGVMRCRAWGFGLAAFFILLAPSSSVVPVATQTIAEHRMYLALLIPVVFGVMAWKRAAAKLPRGVFIGVIVATGAGLAVATHARNGLYQSATALWADTILKVPDNARAFNNLGVALLDEGRLPEAKKAFARAVELRPNHAFALHNLGTAHLREGAPADAVEAFSRAVAVDPMSAQPRTGLGLALAQLGRNAEAESAFEEAIRIDAESVDAMIQLAKLRRQAGRDEEAFALLREAAHRHPELADARYELALSLEKRGDMVSAIGEMDAAVALRPDWMEARLALGNLLGRLNKVAEAERAFREAVRLDPASADARYALGSALARREAFVEAATALRAAVTLAPDHLKAWANLGNCLLVTGRIDEAIACYDEVLRRNPGDVEVRENREVALEFVRAQKSKR